MLLPGEYIRPDPIQQAVLADSANLFIPHDNSFILRCLTGEKGDIIITGNGIHIQSCTFLNWDGNVFFCDIYETRPQVCRDYETGSVECLEQRQVDPWQKVRFE